MSQHHSLCHSTSVLLCLRFRCVQQSLDTQCERGRCAHILTRRSGVLPTVTSHCKSGPSRGICVQMENILMVCKRNHSVLKKRYSLFVSGHFRIMPRLIPLDPGVYIYSICNLKRRSPEYLSLVLNSL